MDGHMINKRNPFINYRSVSDLNNAIVKYLQVVPADITLIVGVPRSGMLPASLLALYLHLPLTDVEGFIEGRIIQSGPRLNADSNCKKIPTSGRALIVDDSVASGSAMTKVKARIEASQVLLKPVYAAIFIDASVLSSAIVDLSFESVPLPRLFEWNLLNSWYCNQYCVDIDGFLCRDPTPEENDDGKEYINFIKNTPLIIGQRKEFGYVVTSRLEKYRKETEFWLFENKIRYKKLYMMNYETAEERQRNNKYSEFKSKIYLESNSVLFIESSERISIEIARKTLKPVFCTDVKRMILPGNDDIGIFSAVSDALLWKISTKSKAAKTKLAKIIRLFLFEIIRRIP